MKNRLQKIIGSLFLVGLLSLGWYKSSQHTSATIEESFYWYCPVCQGQNLFESNHPVALKVMEDIEEMKTHGLSTKDIALNLEGEYGDRISRAQISKNILLFLLAIYWVSTLKFISRGSENVESNR